MLKVLFTASVYNLDTEESFHGWVDPQWSMFQLRSEDTDVRAFEVETEAEALELIESYIGAADSFDGETYYAADSRMNNETGENWSYAAHIRS
jgi:hypothetical protein